MITKIHIQALKSIRDLTVKCKKLNLIVGTNSSGKSTFLQGILLEAQNAMEQWGLNGPLVELGEFKEVHNQTVSRSTPIKIEIWHDEDEKPSYTEFSEDDALQEGCDVRTSMSEPSPEEMIFGVLDDKGISYPVAHGIDIRYVSSQRIGVRDSYTKNLLQSDDFGKNGEYTIAYLQQHADDVLNSNLQVNAQSFGDTLSGQVNYWLSRIFGNTTMVSRSIPKTNFVQILYNNNPDNINQEDLYCRPINIGTGISYVISILIVCLASQELDAIVIENPEIHLHPKAQSELSKFFYFISQANRQLFIETHSDHIFNGVRAGIATGAFNEKDIAVNFFVLKNNMTQCNPIVFGKFGKISGENKNLTLEDLFDQFEIDLDEMMGL